jgi:GNAT superfamily N-acetyltransferase
VQRFRFEPEEVDTVIADVHGLLLERGRDACAWEIGSTGRPTDLAELLLARGMEWAEHDSHQAGMVLDREPEPGPPDVAVRVADTLEDYIVSEAIAHLAFGGAVPSDEHVAALFERRNPDVSRRYIASIDGVDVGTAAATFVPDGVVLNAGSTLPDHRGRGAYRALVRARWDDAAAAGTPVLVTQAGEMSRPILERLGFRQICTILALVDRFGAPRDP